MSSPDTKNDFQTTLAVAGVLISALAVVIGVTTAREAQNDAFEADIFIAYVQSDCLEQRQILDNASKLDKFTDQLTDKLEGALSCDREETSDVSGFEGIQKSVAALILDDRDARYAARFTLTSLLPTECTSPACLNFLAQKLDGGRLLRKGSYRTSLGIALAITRQNDTGFLQTLAQRGDIVAALTVLSSVDDETMNEIAGQAVDKINETAPG